jgi:hypothetical protein
VKFESERTDVGHVIPADTDDQGVTASFELLKVGDRRFF